MIRATVAAIAYLFHSLQVSAFPFLINTYADLYEKKQTDTSDVSITNKRTEVI